MTAKRKPGSGKATVKSEQFKPEEPTGKNVRAQTMAPEPEKVPEPAPSPAAPEHPKRAIARFKINSDSVTTIAHGPANYPVKNGEVELPATAEWWRPLVDAGILTPIS